jgi:EF-P beta-lysylation protein EpmB
VGAEETEVPGFTDDPVGELGLFRGDGLLSKYQGRALVVATGACAIHCRYCFRRHFPYDAQDEGTKGFSSTIDAVAADQTICEVIISGGDPLILPDDRLAGLVTRLAGVPHVRRLRLHTRLPVVLPERVDVALTEWIAACGLPVIVVIHANHPQEINEEVRRALRVLAAAGVSLFNQAVLLRGINDSTDVLEGLSNRLFDCGVLPYYLHLLDRVAGAAHFEVDEHRAVTIMETLRTRLPGYLVPRLVREIEGAPSKVVVG